MTENSQQSIPLPNQYYHGYNPPPRKKTWIYWLIGIAAFILLVIAVSLIPSQQEPKEALFALESDYIAVVHVTGTMSTSATDDGYDQDYLTSALQNAIDNEYNRGLVLYIDTPGGEVIAVDQLSQLVEEYKATGRPVMAYGVSYAASGGYWLAAQADSFYLNRYCITGSIGVTFGTLFDISGLLEKYGINTETISSGDNKGMGSYVEAMTEEQRAIYQSIIDEYYGYFLDEVAQGRKMSKEELKPLADGRIFSATQAVEAGLGDGVMDYEEALEKFVADNNLENCEVYDYIPEKEPGFWELLSSKADNSDPISQTKWQRGFLAYCYL